MAEEKTLNRAAKPFAGNIFRSLSSRNFRLFFAGQGVSLVGTWMQQAAMSWLIYRLTNSKFLLGLVPFVSQIPMLLLAPVAGVYADRWDRHKIMLITQTLAMLQAFVVAALVLGRIPGVGPINIWEILLLNGFVGCINAFDMPARQAFFVSMIERREDLGNAIALNSSIVNIGRVIGPAVAGLAIAAWGEGICFVLNGLSFLAVLAALLAMTPVVHARSGEGQSVLRHMKEGMGYAAGFQPIRSILLLLALVSLMGVPYAVLMPAVAKDILGGGPHTYGFLMSAAGVGALIGAIYLAARKSVLGLGRVMAISTMMFGVALIGFALSRTIWLSMVFLVLAGFGMITPLAASNTLLQTIVEDRMRGRIMSIYSIAFLGMVPFGSLMGGSLAAHAGVPFTIAAGGVVCVLGGLAFAERLPVMRELIRPIYIQRGILPGEE